MNNNNAQIDVILVGRHASDLPANINVVETRNITWATTHDECRKQANELAAYANSINAGVLLQNSPAILTSVLVGFGMDAGYSQALQVFTWGLIVSVMGERPADERVLLEDSFPDSHVAVMVAEAMNTANPRVNAVAKLDNGSVVVEYTKSAIIPFKFSHIEWL